MTEAQIHKAVIDHWKAAGLPQTLVATIPNHKAHGQPGLTPGLSDLMIVAPGLPIGFIELKRNGGKLSDAQNAFLELCDGLNIPCAVTYGRDEPIKILEEWNVVRSAAK